jgi:hypothetical protein
MKTKTLFKFSVRFTAFCFVLLGASCSKDDDNLTLKPEVELSIAEQSLKISVKDTLSIIGENTNAAFYEEEWKLDDNIVSNANSYDFIPNNVGEYKLTYRAFNSAGEFAKTYSIDVKASIRPVTDQSSPYLSDLFEYLPAPGQFINTNLGNETGAQSILGEEKGLISLGAWGGSISLGFDHTVINQEDNNDLIIYANAPTTFAEPGVVWVMQDENANGLADDTWYQIKGSAHDKEGAIENYSLTYFRPETATDDVPWEDSEGNTGFVLTNAFHNQAYYPESITEDSYTITGTLLPDTNIDQSNPSFITSAPFEYGYADNTMGGDEIDLADAIDSEGNPIDLEGADFIKIQTGLQVNMGWLGELSTEVRGIADLSLLN